MRDGARVLITGATGQVGAPVATALAGSGGDVVAVGRFTDASARRRLEGAGVRCVVADLADPASWDDLPASIDHLANFAVARTNDWATDLATNVEGLGLLLARYPDAESVLHCSSTAVYEPKGHDRLVETDPLGDNHRPFGFMPTYSIGKIAAESMAAFSARQWGVPTTIARLSVPYGAGGGWPAFHLALMRQGEPVPVHVDAPSEYNPIHSDDIVAMVPRLFAAASVPATVVNWAGVEVVSIEAWCGYLGELTGLEPTFAPTEATIASVAVDTARMEELIGPTTVGWRDGMARMVDELQG